MERGHGLDREDREVNSDSGFATALLAAENAKNKGYPEAQVYQTSAKGHPCGFRRAMDVIQDELEANSPFKVGQEVWTLSAYGDIQEGKVTKIEEKCIEVNMDKNYYNPFPFRFDCVAEHSKVELNKLREMAIKIADEWILKSTDQHHAFVALKRKQIKKLERQIKKDKTND